MMNLSDQELKMFLRYAYLPAIDHSTQEMLSTVCVSEKHNAYPTQDAHETLCTLIEKQFQARGVQKILIPCGGGIDSRVLLGAALDVFEPRRIELVTYGTPAQLDYKIGKEIAAKFDLVNHVINLNELVWPELVHDYDGDGWYVERIINNFSHFELDDYLTLIGFMGDPSTGSHLSKSRLSINEAFDEFDRKNVFTKGSYQVEALPLVSLEGFPFMDDAQLSFYEQLDFSIRQGSYIKNIFPKHKNVYFPFYSKEWLTISLNLNEKMRRNQRWYRNFARSKYPDLFKIGTKGTYGFNIQAPTYLIRMLLVYNKILSVLTKKRLGLESLNSNYFNFHAGLPASLVHVERMAFQYAIRKYPELNEYNYSDPMFKSLVCSVGMSHD